MMEDGNPRLVQKYLIYAHGKEAVAAETRIAIDAALIRRDTFDPANTEIGRDYGQ